MCEPLRNALEAGKRDGDEGVRRRWAQLEAAMMHFVEGGRITRNLVKQLAPPKYEHWELISRSPKPSLRVFGRFRFPDVFIGTHVKERKGMGGMWSPQFEHEKLVCEEYWDNCGLRAPYTDAPHFVYEHYITQNASEYVRIAT